MRSEELFINVLNVSVETIPKGDRSFINMLTPALAISEINLLYKRSLHGYHQEKNVSVWTSGGQVNEVLLCWGGLLWPYQEEWRAVSQTGPSLLGHCPADTLCPMSRAWWLWLSTSLGLEWWAYKGGKNTHPSSSPGGSVLLQTVTSDKPRGVAVQASPYKLWLCPWTSFLGWRGQVGERLRGWGKCGEVGRDPLSLENLLEVRPGVSQSRWGVHGSAPSPFKSTFRLCHCTPLPFPHYLSLEFRAFPRKARGIGRHFPHHSFTCDLLGTGFLPFFLKDGGLTGRESPWPGLDWWEGCREGALLRQASPLSLSLMLIWRLLAPIMPYG